MSIRSRRRRRHLVFFAAMMAVVVGANWAAYGRNVQADLSDNGRFSLSSDTTRLAKSVSSHLEITAFLSNLGGQARDARFLLARYHELNPRITYRVVDPDTNPGEALRFGINRYSTVVLAYRGRRVDAPDAQELELSTAMLRLLRGVTPTVCILTGHGEPSLTDTSPTGLSSLNTLLTQNAYRTQPLDLTSQTNTVPSGCNAVAILAPVEPLLASEVTTIVAWARAGGKLLVLASPLTNGDPNPLLAPWAVHYAGGLVLDPLRNQGLDLSNVIVQDLPSASPVDEGVSSLQFPAGGGLVVNAGTTGGLTIERLAVSSSQSWDESQPDTQTRFHAGDIPGPVTVAVAADDSAVLPGSDTRLPGSTSHIVRTRLVVTGGDAWATNAFLGNLGNRRFMVNALAWLTQEEQFVAATSRPNVARPLPLTPERRARILILTVGVVPGAIVGAGILGGAIIRRRRGPAKRHAPTAGSKPRPPKARAGPRSR